MIGDGTGRTHAMRIFRPADDRDTGYLAKCRVLLPDRPGSLARFASSIAAAGGNITFFHYDRAIDSSRVVVEVQLRDRAGLDALAAAVNERAASGADADRSDEVQITSTDNILEIRVKLENRPGTLAAFAGLLAGHDANVIYMLYDEDIDPASSTVAMAARSTGEIDAVLNALNAASCHYRVVYQGRDAQEAQHVIGLKLVEKFFLRLQRLLPSSSVEELRSLVRSSRDLEQDLIGFSAAAGNDLEAGDVFEKVLTLASRSRSWTGERFHCRVMPRRPLSGGVELHGFRMPTSENVYLLRHGAELALFDAGHGIYYEDFKQLIRQQGMDPAAVKHIYITHPDTDHAGMAGYFEAEFGSHVHQHPDCDDVIRHQNRAWGASGGLLNLNKYYTRLSSVFTRCRFPSDPKRFRRGDLGTIGGFRIIDECSVGPLAFEVLESRGGHTPGLVFFLNRSEGILITSDFLINMPSLQPDEREHLGIYRYLLTNPNRDSAVFREETASLKELARSLDADMRTRNKELVIYPGHGMPYPAGAIPAANG